MCSLYRLLHKPVSPSVLWLVSTNRVLGAVCAWGWVKTAVPSYLVRDPSPFHGGSPLFANVELVDDTPLAVHLYKLEAVDEFAVEVKDRKGGFGVVDVDREDFTFKGGIRIIR